jgi:hypothetical protein
MTTATHNWTPAGYSAFVLSDGTLCRHAGLRLNSTKLEWPKVDRLPPNIRGLGERPTSGTERNRPDEPACQQRRTNRPPPTRPPQGRLGLTETTSKETPMTDPIPGQTRRQSRVEAAHAARTADDHTIAANLIAAVRGLDSPRATSAAWPRSSASSSRPTTRRSRSDTSTG